MRIITEQYICTTLSYTQQSRSAMDEFPYDKTPKKGISTYSLASYVDRTPQPGRLTFELLNEQSVDDMPSFSLKHEPRSAVKASTDSIGTFSYMGLKQQEKVWI
jgi:hypothetical protein